MARLLRSYGVSKLRPPPVVGASTVFEPVKVELARLPPTPLRATTTHLRRPIEAAVVVATLAYPVTVKLARGKPRPPVAFHLRAPAVVGDSITFPPVEVRIVPPPKQGRASSWKLQPPSVTGASITFPPPRVKLARTPGAYQKAQSKLRAPAVLGAVVVVISAPVRVVLAKWRPQRPVTAKVRPPAAVGASITFRPVVTKLARTPQSVFKASSKLRPPATLQAVVLFVSYPVRVMLARWKPEPARKTRSRLRPPTAVGASTVFRPIKTRLVTRPRQAGGAKKVGWRKVPGLAEVIVFVTGFFDRPSVDGDLDGGTTTGSFFDDGTSGGGMDEGSAGGDFFDPPDVGKS